MNWLYVYFPSLQLNLISHEYSEHDVVAIVNVSNNEIVQLNNAALEVGLKVNMGLATALAMHHDIHLVEYQDELEQTKLNDIANKLYLHTAEIALFPPKGLCLRVNNMLGIYKNIETYWQQIKLILDDAQLNFHYATAYSALAAQLLAETKLDCLLTKQETVIQHLYPLPIERLKFPNHISESLIRVGIKKIGNLVAISLKDLAKRFPIEVIQTIGKLTGELKQQLSYYHAPFLFEKNIELNYEISNSTKLIHPIKALLSDLERYLLQRGLTTASLQFVFKQSDNRELALLVNSAQHQYQAKSWLDLLPLYLENLKLAAPIRSVQLSCRQLFPNNEYTEDLFSRKANATNHAQLINLLHAKLGQGHVFRPNYQAQHHPEHANRICPVESINSTEVLSPQTTNDIPKLRPSYLLPEPVRLSVAVELISSPERIQTNWWSHGAICRDYFIARTQQGQLCWVFRQPDQGWFVHGYFG